MKDIFLLILFCFISSFAFSQDEGYGNNFRMVGTCSWSPAGATKYVGTVTLQSDLTGKGYLGTQVTTSHLIFTPTEQTYAVDSVLSTTFSSATIRIVERGSTTGSPTGQVLIYAETPEGKIPQLPFGSTGATTQLQAAIDTWNARVAGGISGLTANYLTKATSGTSIGNSILYCNGIGLNIGGTSYPDATSLFEIPNQLSIFENGFNGSTNYFFGSLGNWSAGHGGAAYNLANNFHAWWDDSDGIRTEFENNSGPLQFYIEGKGEAWYGLQDTSAHLWSSGYKSSVYGTEMAWEPAFGISSSSVMRLNSSGRLKTKAGLVVGSTYFASNEPPVNGALFEGRVGFGKTTASEALDISGNILLTQSSGSSQAVKINAIGTGSQAAMYVDQQGATGRGMIVNVVSNASGDYLLDGRLNGTPRLSFRPRGNIEMGDSLIFKQDVSMNTFMRRSAEDSIALWTGGALRLGIGNSSTRITGNTYMLGRLGVGIQPHATSAAYFSGTSFPTLKIRRDASFSPNGAAIQLESYGTSGVAIANTEGLGTVSFAGHDGTTLINGAQIRAVAAGTVSTGDIATKLSFWTKPSGGGALAERLTVTPDGDVGIGTVTPGKKLEVAGEVKINTINNASTDTDKFLVADAGTVKHRTGTQLVGDVGFLGSSFSTVMTAQVSNDTLINTSNDAGLFSNVPASGGNIYTISYTFDVAFDGTSEVTNVFSIPLSALGITYGVNEEKFIIGTGTIEPTETVNNVNTLCKVISVRADVTDEEIEVRTWHPALLGINNRARIDIVLQTIKQ